MRKLAFYGKQLDENERAQILVFYNEGYSTRKIASKLGVSQGTVVNTNKKWNNLKHSGILEAMAVLQFVIPN